MAPRQSWTISLSFIFYLCAGSLAQSAIPSQVATAQPMGQVPTAPTCAQSCVQQATDIKTCAETDQACLCLQASKIQDSISSCLKSSNSCSDLDKSAAIMFYPQLCSSLGYPIASTGGSAIVPAGVTTAGGTPPSKVTQTRASNLVVSVDGAIPTSTTISSAESSDHTLTLPAILGVSLAGALVFLALSAVILWAILRRRQFKQRPRMNLDCEFQDPLPRPHRSISIHSDFIVQPSPVEKDSFGADLSRSSTLVAPPPIGKDEKYQITVTSLEDEEMPKSRRDRVLERVMNDDRLRMSLLSMSSLTSHPTNSLMVEPLTINKDDSAKATEISTPSEPAETNTQRDNTDDWNYEGGRI